MAWRECRHWSLTSLGPHPVALGLWAGHLTSLDLSVLRCKTGTPHRAVVTIKHCEALSMVSLIGTQYMSLSLLVTHPSLQPPLICLHSQWKREGLGICYCQNLSGKFSTFRKVSPVFLIKIPTLNSFCLELSPRRAFTYITSRYLKCFRNDMLSVLFYR